MYAKLILQKGISQLLSEYEFRLPPFTMSPDFKIKQIGYCSHCTETEPPRECICVTQQDSDSIANSSLICM